MSSRSFSLIKIIAFGLLAYNSVSYAETEQIKKKHVEREYADRDYPERAYKGFVVPQNYPVVVPNTVPAFEGGISAIWLKPGASNLNYVIYNNELPAQSPTWLERELKPSYSSAFELSVKAIFTCGRDARLTWTHFNASDAGSTTTPSDAFFLGPDYEIGPAGLSISDSTGNVKFTYNVVNLDLGQSILITPLLNLRFFAGLSYGDLKEQVNSNYSGIRGGDFPGPFSMQQNVRSQFTGIGPRFGVDADYTLANGFGLMGEAGISALIGSMRSLTTFTGSGVELLELFGQTVNHQWIKDENVQQVIPGFDAKLGVTYQRRLGNQANLKLTLGYQAAVYVNAISQYLPGSLVEGAPLESGGIFVATMEHRLSNYSVQGPFFNVTVDV